tara:strand:+ start:3092 stop:5485 length:2394 start_codon:yes stop_codon:yes gene_type:complete
MRTVQVYIEGQRLELFKDEQISVTSIQQNVQDISKVMTDFSQSFSVPATPSNNAIFQHFYQNDVQSTIDHNIRRDAYIEIDLTTFRRGKMSLEKSEVKNNEAYSYQITFYGDITSLKDKFGDDKLQDLTLLNLYTHNYTGLEIKDRIIDGTTNYVIRYPLIFNRDITYGNGGSTDINPATGTGSVIWNELFPAIRLAALFGAIQGKYGVTFNGTFLTDKRFQNAYLYCKNAEDFTFVTESKLMDITGGSTDIANYNTIKTYGDYFDLSTDTLSYGSDSFSEAFPGATPAVGLEYTNYVTLVITSLTPYFPQTIYYIDVVLNNQIVQTFERQGIGSINIVQETSVNNLNANYQFRFRAESGVSLTFQCRYGQQAFITSGSGVAPVNNEYFGTGTVSVSNQISVLNYVPNMTVSDFFRGILKMFNLTCYGLEDGVFQIEPLDDWYAKGAIVDITQYTDIKSIKVDRLKLFKTIEFNYQESESATNTIFKNLTGRGYGNTRNTFDYDGGAFKVELPFENMMMQRFQGTNLQIGETINQDGNKYVPKPMIIYEYEELAQDYRFTDETSTSPLTEYVPFGQDVDVLTENFTLNFNADISTLTNIAEQNTLFRTYYSGYLLNLFDLKNRRTTVKTNLPVSLLTNLRLNDRVIIRDKRYIIESMKSSLTTGDVDFVLINDFRPLLTGGGIIEPIKPSEDAQCFDVRILFPNGAKLATVTTTDAGVTITPSTLNSEGVVEVCIPANPGATTVLKTEDDLDYINTEDLADRIRTEGGTVAIYTLLVTYTYSNGSQTTNQIFIQQQP